MSPDWVFSVPSSSVPAVVPKVVASEPLKVPGLPASSVSSTCSLSPVTSFTTVTMSEPEPATSLSVTETVSVSPGTDAGVIDTLPSEPPPTVSVSVAVAVPPATVKASL